MRIGLVITELHPGGAEKCLVNLAIYLQDQGHDVAVWELWPEPPPQKRQLTDRLDHHRIAWKSGGAVRPWQFVSATRWLKRELASFQPHVVQSFLFHGNLAASIASRGQAWKLFGGARVKQPQRSRQWLQRWASQRMEKLVCVSESVKKHCREIERIDLRKMTVIPNGVLLNKLDPQPPLLDVGELGIPPIAPILLFVGRLAQQKGIKPMLDHADALLEKLPEHHLVIIGDGPLQSELAERRSACLRKSQIHLLGWQADVISWMNRCEALLLPAEYEGMPNVVLEAMSVSRPIVVFDVEGIRELLGENDTASQQIVRARDYSAFISSIRRLAADAELRERCGTANRKRVEDFFRLETQLGKYLALYEGGKTR